MRERQEEGEEGWIVVWEREGEKGRAARRWKVDRGRDVEWAWAWLLIAASEA